MVADGGVLREGRSEANAGVLQVVLVVMAALLLAEEDSPHSRDGMSCGGDDRGEETAAAVAAADPAQIVFFSGVFGIQGVLVGGAEVNRTGNCGMTGGGGRGFCSSCSSLVSRNCDEIRADRNGRKGMGGGVL